MTKVAITESYLEDIADAIRSKTGVSSATYYPSEMANAIMTISGGGGITPTGTISITENGTYNVTSYASADVSVPTGGTINNQNKTVTPSASQQIITADSGYTGLGTVTISAPPTASFYVDREYEYTIEEGSGKLICKITPYVDLNTEYGDVEGWIANGTHQEGGSLSFPAIESGIVITPTESLQYIGESDCIMRGQLTISAIPSNYIGSGITQRSSTDLTVSGATVTAPAGYYASAASKSVSSMTLPTSTASSATSGYTSKATISRSTSDQYINIAPGYNSAGGYYKISAVANGSASAPSTISGTSATVTTGTNTLTLTKTVSVTPTVSAGYVSSGTAGNSSVSLTASVTTKATATITPGTTNQTIASGTYLTGTQTISGDANLVANNIKKDVSIFGVTGAYEGSGGGSGGLTVATANATPSSASTSISFTNLAGEPTSFAVVSAADLATGASPWKTAAVVFDGTDLHGQTIRNTSNAQVSYDNTDFSKSYSNGTLTITGSGTNFQANQYKLVYTYGGSDIGTADVQVGSGATSITFTGLEEEPSYFSCIFKSNFSTSSGYQRVIVVVYDGTSTYGMEMDSSAKHSTAHWTYSYSSGSLTITSSGTNAGGYFHQPGYYQLTYAVEGSSGNYQSKTVYATSSQQVITADSGYDALKKVTIPAVTTTNLIASNILSGVTIQVGDAADSDRITSITGNVVLQNYYTGSSAPSSSTGSNGDLYLQS